MDSETQALVRPTEVTQVDGNLVRGASSPYANISADGFLLEYVTVLKKHRWRVFTVAVVVVTLSTISALKAIPLYIATGRIAINRETPVNLGFHDTDPDVDDYDTNVALETQVKILQSKVLAAEVIKNAGLVTTPDSANGMPTSVSTSSTLESISAQEKAQINRYLSSLGVKVLPGTRVLEIQYTDPNPRHAADMVNETIHTYIDQNYQTKVNATNQTAVWLQKELTDLRLKMETAEAELIKYQKENNIFGVDDKQNIISSTLDDLNKRLTEAETERIQKESMYQMAADGHADLFEQQEVGGTMLDRLRERQSDLREQYTMIRTSLGPHYPKSVEIQNQLEQTQAEIDAENGRLALKLKRDYMAAINREKLLTAALDEQKAKSNAMSQSAIQFNILKRDADSYRTVYEGLLQKMKEAGISVGLKSNNVRVLDAADVPGRPSSPNVPRSIGMGLVLGLLGGLGLAFVLESLDNTIRTPEQAHSIVGLPSLGVIPLYSGYITPSYGGMGYRRVGNKKSSVTDKNTKEALALITVTRPKSELSESYRALRTAILLSSAKGPPKVLLITSPLPSEGKTTTSINVSTVLAQQGGRVLLIDCDLRRPSIHKMLHVPQAPGITALLAGSADETAVIHPTSVPGLFLIPGGAICPNPTELLSSQTMRGFLNRWQNEYDHVIIDSAPALSVTDAVILSVQVDSVLLVLRAGDTTKTAYRRACGLFGQVNARLLGTVLNGLDVYASDYQYYYYGKYYGGSDHPSKKYYGEHAKPDAGGTA